VQFCATEITDRFVGSTCGKSAHPQIAAFIKWYVEEHFGPAFFPETGQINFAQSGFICFNETCKTTDPKQPSPALLRLIQS
jgi:hypothetical protein